MFLLDFNLEAISMSNEPTQRISVKDLISEHGAKELATSLEMEPYRKLIIAQSKGSTGLSELAAIRNLPIEKHYVWRVASALERGLVDFDSKNVDADKKTLTLEDLARVTELLRYRPIQLCQFLKALLGGEEMQRMMIQAIVIANQVD
jgi:hypothetical protein